MYMASSGYHGLEIANDEDAPATWQGTEREFTKALEFVENIMRVDGCSFAVRYDPERQLFEALCNQ